MSFQKPSSWINPPTPDITPKRIAVEGLIGAGKTHFAHSLSTKLGYFLLEEPVKGNNLLGLFYQQPDRFAFAMQVKMLSVRLSMERAGTYMVKAGVEKGVIFDRSLAGDTVFMELNTAIGNITLEEARVYLNLFEQMKTESPYPDILIFLDVPLKIIRQRIRARGRKFEQGLLKEDNLYLEGLLEGYNRFLEALSYHTCVVRLDWEEFRTIQEVWPLVEDAYQNSNHSRFKKVLLRW